MPFDPVPQPDRIRSIVNRGALLPEHGRMFGDQKTLIHNLTDRIARAEQEIARVDALQPAWEDIGGVRLQVLTADQIEVLRAAARRTLANMRAALQREQNKMARLVRFDADMAARRAVR